MTPSAGRVGFAPTRPGSSGFGLTYGGDAMDWYAVGVALGLVWWAWARHRALWGEGEGE